MMNKRMARKASNGPTVVGMSRREFLLLTGAIAVAAGASNAPAHAEDVPSKENLPQRSSSVSVLPKNPTQNPGFNVRKLPDQKLLLWARRSEQDLRAYRINSDGYCIWRLCDGTREPAQIAGEYERLTHRPGREADAFLSELLKLGVVASGAKVVAIGDAPRKG